MKTFIAIFVSTLAISVTAQADMTQVLAKEFRIAEATAQKCLDDNNLKDLDMEQLEAALHKKDSSSEDLDEFLTDFGCTMTCLFEKAGVFEDDEVLLDELVKWSNENKYPMNDDIKEKLSKCIDTAEQQDDKCKLGYVLTTCMAHHVY